MPAFGLLVLAGLFTAQADEVSPVDKVITMLEDLQIQVINEGKAESKTYDKFACFCKDMSEEKSAEITSGQDAVSDLEASIGSLNSDRSTLDSEIEELSQKITTLNNEISKAKDDRKKANAVYMAEHAEISTGLRNLKGALKEMKAKQSAVSLLQTDSFDKVKEAAHIAIKHINKSEKTYRLAQKLIQMSAPERGDDYAFQGGEIISMIADLRDDFKDTKSNLETDEEEAVSTFNTLITDKTSEMNTSIETMNNKKKRTAQKTEMIATKSGDLTATKAVLTDDQTYIKELTAKCELKSKEWDQRSQMRQDELTAISTAINIVGGKVKEKTTSKTVRFMQIPKPMKVEDKVQDTDDDEVDEIMETEEVTNFLQVQKPRKRLAQIASHMKMRDMAKVEKKLFEERVPEQNVRDKVVAMIKESSIELKSPTLAMLASRVAADPFVKIKKLIQELIERLLQEAADEANHKGWCDKETGKAKQQRDTKAQNVKDLNHQMSENESKRDKLTEEIAILTIELRELNDSLSKMTKERSDESAENSATVSEAEEGKEAVEQAIDVLSKFYKTAAKAEVFTQESASGVDDDMPDTGFKGANKGSQGAAAGILGMLDVILSDFERTISETEKAEKNADKEFLEFETTTKVSIGTKTVGKETNEAELQETEQNLREEKDDMTSEQELLDKALQELQELQPACVQTAMSYEERVAKREQEIESLKRALCVLGMEGPVQTEPGCDKE
jgi:chromosome segregation ATPase